ncbi:SRPBCC family protein [Nocardia alni]|uniref:SRPBCC family protein n=1 Tax=Nocardia alni TaxID=2815723 RepID=UPI001C23EAD1|nr:SRPBCC family protein [Nocardia alni]
MKIANEFTVSAPLDRAWAALTDLEQVVPLMPGAQMTGWDGDRFLGRIKVKVGPVTSEFNGEAHFVDRDELQHRVVIDGRGRESRGSGNASATITTQLYPEGDKTRVQVDTDLKIVGKLAQFGSGMLQQVSEKLLGQFVTSLEAELAADNRPADSTETIAPQTETVAPRPDPGATIRSIAPAEPEALDLVGLAGPAVLRKMAPALGVALVVLLVLVIVRRRR